MTQEIARLAVTIGANTRDLEDGLRTANTETNNFARRMRTNIRRTALAVGGGALAMGTAAVNAAISWETSFADVRKTVTATPEELAELEETLRNMATSDVLGGLENAHFELSNIASLAGQLGVQTSDIDEFTESIAALVVASDLSAEDAASFAARFGNVVGLDIAEDIDNLANALVFLGNNSAASESDIKSFAERLAPLATFDWNAQDILGFSTAMASVGLSSELGSSNLFKTVTDLQTAVSGGGEDLQLWAEAAGMTVDEFRELEGMNPAAALEAFIGGLAEMNADERLRTLTDLGIDSGEQQRVLLQLAGGYQTLSSSIDMSYESWSGSNAAMEEARTKAETTQGGINRLINNFRELGIEMGNRFLPAVNSGIEGLTQLTSGETMQGLENLTRGFTELGMQIVGAFMNLDAQEVQERFNLIFETIPGQMSTIGETVGRDLARDARGMMDNWAEEVDPSGIFGNRLDVLADVVLPQAFGFEVEPVIATGNRTEDDLRQQLEEQLAIAFYQSDDELINVLVPMATELGIDPQEVQEDAQDIILTAMENGTYTAAIAANVEISAAHIDTGPITAQFQAAMQNLQANAMSTSGAGLPQQSTPQTPAFHTGGIFNAPAGTNEGLALLRDGEMVLTPGQQIGMRGSSTNITNVVYGQAPYEVASMVERAIKDRGYR